MAKATLKLANGTVVDIEGSADEVRQLLAFYGGGRPTALGAAAGAKRGGTGKAKTRQPPSGHEGKAPDLGQIVNLVKTCDEAELIEQNVLDQTSIVNRTLLPLYIVHQCLEASFGLTSGDIAKVTRDLGVPVSQPNASTALSGTASRYVIGDKVRIRGQAVRYTLSRRGVQFMVSVIRGTPDENEK